jgi:WhiB family redox-sensing transcriptional regulator
MTDPRPMPRPKTFLQLVTNERPPCTKEDPELFFPISYMTDDYRFQIQQAKAVCKSCPIAAACLEFALDVEDGFAILGGMTPGERQRIKFQQGFQQRRAA